LSQKAETVWLASDEDREGEAISWHLSEELNLDPKKTKRIVFHEITKNAILKAIDNPRSIDYNLVNAQQARRVLDRLVGYELSPVLWKKVKGGLSAGRVQSVSVRLIVEKEREIQAFKTKAAYHINAEFSTQNGKIVKAKLGKQFATRLEAENFLKMNIEAQFKVAQLETKPAKKTPAAPFTTSTLQQEAARKLYLPVGITMQIAQRLYEAGHITYMRTDSVNLSEDARKAAAAEIIRSYGKEFSKPRSFTNKSKGAQEAHEAIRPTDMSAHSLPIDRDQARLYDLIWKRTLASQMADAELEKTQVTIETNKHNELFVANGEVIKFEGFLKVYLEGHDDDEEEQEGMLPALKVNEVLKAQSITATERFSRPPSRYTEASLVKKLEELGIGRPSTYAPTISTIINRSYIEKGNFEGESRKYQQVALIDNKITAKELSENTGSDKGKLVPTDIGIIVNDFLVKNFESILDYNFTAKVEQDFDAIAEGNENWTHMMQEFYDHFHPIVVNVEENAERESGERILGTDPKSGKPILVRLGKYGPMAQIGNADDEDKVFASLNPDQNIGTITLEEALKLFLLPKKLGVFEGEEVEVSNGRYGPYVRFGKTFISLEKGEDPLEVNFERAQVLIQMKLKADAPIAVVDGLPVQKGVGRFGPFIKWNDLFINVNKKYNFDNLSKSDIQELIDDKMKKEEEKVLHHWEDENIRVEKARWGRSIIFHGKVKIELPKEIDATKLTLEDVKKRLDALAASKPAKKTVKKVVKKTTSAAKKATKPKATKPKAVKK
jgi:DNA topoisomerase-1